MSTPGTLRLCNAVRHHDLKEVSKLLKEGADINDKTLDGDTVLHVACYEGFDDLVEYLLDHFARPNAKDKTGRTPLHIAARRGKLKICQMLVERKAKINAEDDLGNTPIREALDAGHKDVVKLLKAASSQGLMKKVRNFLMTWNRH